MLVIGLRLPSTIVEDVTNEAAVVGGDTASLRDGATRGSENCAGGRKGRAGNTHVVQEEGKEFRSQ
jgi:hypothetical protein